MNRSSHVLVSTAQNISKNTRAVFSAFLYSETKLFLRNVYFAKYGEY